MCREKIRVGYAGDSQRALLHDHAHALGIDPRELDHDRQLVRVLGMEAVHVRAEAVPQAREARDLPEIGEELLDLPSKAVGVAAWHPGEPTHASTIRVVSLVRRLVKVIGAALAFAVYVWFAAVHSAGRVKRRKAARRRARAAAR